MINQISSWSVEGITGCYLVVLGHYGAVLVGSWLVPYMQKTCDVAEKAILAKKNCGQSA